MNLIANQTFYLQGNRSALPPFTCPAYPFKEDLENRIFSLVPSLLHSKGEQISQMQFEEDFRWIFSKGNEADLLNFVFENEHFNTMHALPDLIASANPALSCEPFEYWSTNSIPNGQALS